MPPGASIDPALLSELKAVYALYAALMREPDSENGIGGRLIFVGELDRDGSRLVRAANIAGAASLCATSDVPVQKQAIREGVIDFLVTSLDEALRILKNELRKHNAVAVCVGVPASQVGAEMIERGVRPDLLRSNSASDLASFVAEGARFVETPALPAGHCLTILPVADAESGRRALESIPESDYVAHRWLRLSSRYLGPQARGVRAVPSKHDPFSTAS
jgi:urocanate hydratase